MPDEAMGDRSVEFKAVARLDNLAVLRTLVGAVAVFEDLDMDAVADLQLAVDEACTRLIRSAVPDAMLVVRVNPSVDTVTVDVSTTCLRPEEVIEQGSFSWHLLNSLTDDVRMFSDGQGPDTGRVFGISMTARRVSQLQ